LQVGLNIWDKNTHNVMTVPSVLKDAKFLNACSDHYTTTRDDFMTLVFSRPTQLYVLAHEYSRVPPWLREQFILLPQHEIMVKWNFAMHAKILMTLSQNWGEMSTARMMVWQCKAEGNTTYKLGGLGGQSSVTDHTFAVAWKPAATDVDKFTGGQPRELAARLADAEVRARSMHSLQPQHPNASTHGHKRRAAAVSASTSGERTTNRDARPAHACRVMLVWAWHAATHVCMGGGWCVLGHPGRPLACALGRWVQLLAIASRCFGAALSLAQRVPLVDARGFRMSVTRCRTSKRS
jgi:hypothetical protein